MTDRQKTVLIVDDAPGMRLMLRSYLEPEGYDVLQADSAETALRLAKEQRVDLIILDIMLPKRDGIEVCQNLRAAGKKMPILMLTAKDTTEDKILGLETGADDYLGKPFSSEELVARIRSLLRRPPLTAQDVFEWEELILDTRSQKVTIKGKALDLTLREYGLLEYFLRNRDKVLTRGDFLEHVWDQNHNILTNVVDVHMKNLRKKLPKKYAELIETIRGKGFRIV